MSRYLLDKPRGVRRSPAQASRNMDALIKLQAGELMPGELFRLVTGAQAPRRRTAKSTTRINCIDCHKSLNRKGDPLVSQPRRCRACGKIKRTAHYKTAKEKINV